MADGNGSKKTNAAKLMVPLTAVGAFVGFGVTVGVYVRGVEDERSVDRHRIEALEHADDTKVDKRDFEAWVRELRRDPMHPPEVPR